MCFSANASFTAAAFLGLVGCINIRKCVSSRQFLFASIPLIFALQQLVEGFLWLSPSSPERFGQYAVIEAKFYLTIAIFVWPIWFPLSLFSLEPAATWRRYALLVLVFLGLAYEALALAQLIKIWPPEVEAIIFQNHIHYLFNEESNVLLKLLYYVTTLVPLFLSSYPFTWVLGAINLIGFLISYHLYTTAFVSVWCFFGALMSIGILISLLLKNRNQ